MDLNKVKEFIKLAKEEGVTSLKYEEKDSKISVELGGSQYMVSHSPVMNTTQEAPKSSAPLVENKSSGGGFYEITSPLVGTFYSASAPGEEAFVKPGDKVSTGQTLCIIEAMKIMNEVDTDVSGEIVEVCVENESLVEFGQVLFKVKKG